MSKRGSKGRPPRGGPAKGRGPGGRGKGGRGKGILDEIELVAESLAGKLASKLPRGWLDKLPGGGRPSGEGGRPSGGEPEPHRDQPAAEAPAGSLEEGALIEARRDWFIGQRAYPAPRIPAAQILEGVLHLAKNRRPGGGTPAPIEVDFTHRVFAVTTAPNRFTGVVGRWTPAGPNRIAGRVLCLAIQATAGGPELYAGTAGGGVWHSPDGGVTWRPLMDYPVSYCGAIGALAVSGEVIYAGTGDRAGYPGIGVLRSPDAGVTWQFTSPLPRPGGSVEHVTALVMHPKESGTVYAAALRGGVYKTTDSGGTWTLLDDGDCFAMIQDPSDADALYVALEQTGLFRVTGGGAIWTSMPLPTDSNFTGLVETRLAISADGQTLYLKIRQDVWRRSGGAWTWLGKMGGLTYGLMSYVRVHPTRPDTIYAAGSMLESFSSSATSTLREFLWAPHVDQWDLVFDPANPDITYIANDGGVYRLDRTTGVPVFTDLNAGLAVTQFYRIDAGAPLPGGPELSLGGGTQDMGVLTATTTDWAETEIRLGDGAHFGVGNAATCEVYAMGYYLDIYRRAVCGGPFESIDEGIARGTAPFIAAFAIDPANQDTLYTGTDSIYVSRTSGVGWQPVRKRGGGRPSYQLDGSPVWCITAANGLVWCGTRAGGIFASNVGVTEMDRVPGQLPPRPVTSIAVDGDVVYATFSGFNVNTPSRPGHVFVRRQVNRAFSWTLIDGGSAGSLPDLPVNAIFIDPNNRNTLYVATDRGVYRSTDAGSNWSPYDNGLPACVVTDFAYWSGTLFAATYGRGVFSLRL